MVVRVRADVINTGKLGTTVLKSATGFHARYPLYLTVSGSDEILSAVAKPEYAGLEPLEYKHAEWFVRANPGDKLIVKATFPKAVDAYAEIIL